jgi:hypothetical protein
MKNYASILIFTLLTCVNHPVVAQSWNLFGPKNFEDCVLEGVKGVKSDGAASAVIGACRIKFPAKTQAQPAIEIDYVALRQYSSLGMNRPTLNALVNNIMVNNIRTVQTGSNSYGVKSYDYGHHLSVEITNRNDFGISGVEVGLSNKSEKCSWDDKDYSEIYFCKGEARPRGSAAFTCQIPRIESRKVFTCITGFGRNTSEADSSAFMSKYSIPRRPQ